MSKYLSRITSTISFVVLAFRTTGYNKTYLDEPNVQHQHHVAPLISVEDKQGGFRSSACSSHAYLQGTHAHAHHVTLYDDTTSPFVMLYIQVP